MMVLEVAKSVPTRFFRYLKKRAAGCHIHMNNSFTQQ